jgi:hypothetical protein
VGLKLDTVEIGGGVGCQAAFVDKSFTLNTIKILSKVVLCIRDSDLNSGSLQINIGEIVDQGTFAIGSSTNPIGTQNINSTVTVNFTGGRPDNTGLIPKDCPAPNFNKGIEVCQGATLRLFGV